MIRRILMIYGSHGAGKSTLARNILGEDFVEENTESGILSSSSDGKIVALGKYSTKCGGCDTIRDIKGFVGVWKLLNTAIKLKKDCNLFVLEGALLSSVFKSTVDNLLKLKYDKGFSVEMVLLSNTVETSLKRVYNRNQRVANKDNIINKVKASARTFTKMAETGEFRCFSIKTDNLTAEQVFEAFRENSKFLPRR